MRVGMVVLLLGFLVVSVGCGNDSTDSSSKADPPPVVQDMEIVQPDSAPNQD